MIITIPILITLTSLVTEALKKGLKFEKRYIPLVSIAIGIILIFLSKSRFNFGIDELIIYGIMIGLASCGLFSGIKSIGYIAKKVGSKLKK